MLSLINFNALQSFRRNFKNNQVICFAFTFICLLGVSTFSNIQVFAQGPVNGGFEGKVIEKGTNKPLAGAVVQFIRTANGFQTAKRSDQSGNFRQDTLQPGDYLIRVTLDGYNKFEQTQSLYATRINAFVPVPVELVKEETIAVVTNPDKQQPDGNNPQPVTTPMPTNTPPLVKNEKVSSDADQGANLNPRRDAAFNDNQVSTLALGGTTLTRTFDELAFLASGIAPPPQAIGNSVGPGVGSGVGTSGQFSVNGLRSRANNFTVDGSDNNDEDIGVRRQGFFTLVPQPIESIQEFQIITLLAPAQYGRNLGAQVNALSKSGGNDFHGTLFGIANASQLNARNFFDNTSGNSTTTLQANRFGSVVDVCLNPSTPLPSSCPNSNRISLTNSAGEKDSLTLLQGGFAVGGRIVRNKLFFFASGEGQLLNATNEKHFAVPTVEERGVFGRGALGIQCRRRNGEVNGVCFDANGDPTPFTPLFPTSVGGNAVFSLFPFANDPNGIYGRNTYTQALSADARGRILSGKVDYNFSSFNHPQTLTARYNNSDDRRDLTDVGGALFSAIRPLVRTDNFSAYLSGGLSNNISNEIRISWGRTRLKFDELPDTTGFLVPVSSSQITNAEDRRFLLNANLLQNRTLPVCNAIGCSPPPFPTYRTFDENGSFGTTAANTTLGPIGQLIVAGFSPVGVDVFNFPQERVNNTFQVADTIRYQFSASGQHSLSLGTDIRRTFLDSDLPRNSRPLVTFNGGREIRIRPDPLPLSVIGLTPPSDFAAAGSATGFFQSLLTDPSSNSNIKLRYNQLNFFAQDEWRIRPNLLLNYGLRYEYNTVPKEADRKIEDAFSLPLPEYLSGLSQFIDGRTSIFESDGNNFAPRLGVAYSPGKNTVIRGGFGLYYDQILGAVVSQSRNIFPTFATVNFGGGALNQNGGDFTLFNPLNAIFNPLFTENGLTGRICPRTLSRGIGGNCGPFGSATGIPFIQPGSLNTINPTLTADQILAALRSIDLIFPSTRQNNGSSRSITLPTRNLNTPFAYQYSIGIEQSFKLLGQNSAVSVGYVGTTGRDLLRFTTPNLGNNFVADVGNYDFFQNNPIAQGRIVSPFTNESLSIRPITNAGSINQFETTGRSRYDSLQIEFRGRLTEKFQYHANYVYGNVKDDVSDVFDLAGAFALPQNSLTFAGEYAPANFDVRHRFTYNFIYDLPELKNRKGGLKYLLGDWQIAGTGKFNTGQPYTVNSIFDVNNDGNLTDRLNNIQSLTLTGDRRQPITVADNANLSNLLAINGQDGSIPRNSFRAGGILDLDLSFIKRFRIKEGQTFQFRTDVFNFINRANFGIPVRVLESSSFGKAIETITPGRRIQFALKYIF